MGKTAGQRGFPPQVSGGFHALPQDGQCRQSRMPPLVMASTSRTRSMSGRLHQAPLEDDLAEGPALGQGLAHDRGRLLVAQVGDEGGGQGGRRLGVAPAAVLVGLEAGQAPVGQDPGRGRQQPHRLQQVAGHHGHGHVELERPGGAGEGHRRVVADDLGRHLHHHLGDHRVDLARHDRAARLEVGAGGSRPGRSAGPLDIQRRSLAIFTNETATVRSIPDASTRASRPPWASKWSRASRRGRPVVATRRAMTAAANPGGALMPGAHRGAAQGQLTQAGQGGLQPLDPVLHRGWRSRPAPGPG